MILPKQTLLWFGKRYKAIQNLALSKFSFPCYFLPRMLKKKKKKSSPLLNCCSLTKMNSPHTKCISSEHRSRNISKLKISKMAAVSLKECIMPEYKISSVTNSILDLLKVATLNCCALKWRQK